MGHIQKIRRLVWGSISVLLAILVATTPLTAVNAASTVWLRGTVSNPRPGPEPLQGVTVYATAPGGTTPLFGPAAAVQWGEYELRVAPGTYDIHFIPSTTGWESGFNAVVESNVVMQANRTLDKTLPYKTVTSPVGFGELRCGTSTPNPNAGIFTLFNNGGYGFSADSMVSQILNPGNIELGSGRSTEAGYTYGGYIQGRVGTETQLSSFTLAPGNYSTTLRDEAMHSAPPVNFTVPNKCPEFSLDVTPGVNNTYVTSDATFPLAIISTAEFDAPGRIDVSSLRFGVSWERLNGLPPESCNAPTDVNNDSRADLVCNVRVSSAWRAGEYNVLLTGRTTDEGSSLDGFKFVRNATVKVGVFMSIADHTSAQPQLSWNALSGATQYKLFRNDQQIATVNGTNYTDTSITAPGDYTYYVQPVMSDGSYVEPSTSIVANVTSLVSAPTNLTAVSPTNTAPVLNWTAASGATGYDIYRNNTKIGSTTTQTTFTDTTLTTDGTYAYNVRAKQGNTQSDPSNTVQVRRETVAPTASNLALSGMQTFTIFNIPLFSYFPANATQTTITAQVADNYGGTGIAAAEYYFDNGTHVPMTVANGTATAANVSLTGLSDGNHTINVRTKDAAGNWSSVISQTFVKF